VLKVESSSGPTPDDGRTNDYPKLMFEEKIAERETASRAAPRKIFSALRKPPRPDGASNLSKFHDSPFGDLPNSILPISELPV
jgi:hypothetical protein